MATKEAFPLGTCIGCRRKGVETGVVLVANFDTHAEFLNCFGFPPPKAKRFVTELFDESDVTNANKATPCGYHACRDCAEVVGVPVVSVDLIRKFGVIYAPVSELVGAK